MIFRTDLASEKEQRAVVGKNHIDGVEKHEYFKGNIKITHIKITDESGAKVLEKPVGNYVTLSVKGGFDNTHEAITLTAGVLCDELKKVCKKFTSVLIVGLGNAKITPDNLGVSVAEKIFATRHIKLFAPEFFSENMAEVSVIRTGVSAATGIESAEIVKAVCEKIRPQLVIVIDALACGEISNLGRTIQITDTGISPGSGVGNARKELSQRTLNVPVVAVGVPTVIDLETAVFQLSDAQNSDKDFSQMMVTPRNIDALMKVCCQIIQTALNKLVHPDLSPAEISSLVD